MRRTTDIHSLQRIVRSAACTKGSSEQRRSDVSFSLTHFSTDFEQMLLALDAGHFPPELKARRSSRSCQARGRGLPNPPVLGHRRLQQAVLVVAAAGRTVSLISHQLLAWATFMSHMQELTSPRYPLRDRRKLFNAMVTPSLFNDSGAWTLTEEIEETPDNTRRGNQDRKFRSYKCRRMSTKSPTTNDTTETLNRRTTRQRSAHKTATSKREATKTLTATPLSTACHKTTQKTIWRHGSAKQCEQHKADDFLAADGMTSWILRQQDTLVTSKDDCQTPRRPLDHAHLQLESSDNQKWKWVNC